MRRFHSYGPVDSEQHFCVERRELVGQCTDYLVGNPGKGGHYFTIWGPRQTGKTWIMRQMAGEIEKRHPGRFAVHSFSMGRLRGVSLDPPGDEPLGLPHAFRIFLPERLPGKPNLTTWEDFSRLFSGDEGLWEKPLILLIDELDTLPPGFLDIMAAQFREMYLEREKKPAPRPCADRREGSAGCRK